MKFSLRPMHRAEGDLLRPLRELRSPLTTDAIKTIVLDRMAAGYSIWSQLRGLIGEFLAVGVVTAVAINFSGFRPVENTEIGHPTISKAITTSDIKIPNASANYRAECGETHSYLRTRSSATALAQNIVPLLDSIAFISVVSSFRGINEVPYALINDVASTLQTQSFISAPESRTEWFSTLSSGAVFSHIRMLGEDAEVGVQNGWRSVGLSLSNANGNRDMHDVLEHHANTSSMVFSENDQTIALLLGANFSLGSVAAKAEIGPAYLFSSTTYVDPATASLSPGTNAGHLGAAAKVSAFYNISDFFQVGVTGISSYQTGQFTNGVFVSISIKP